MQIKKINNNKLKVILNLNDLDEKNIDIDSFLSNPIESQNLFFEILDLAEEKYDFDIDDNRAVVEAISLDNNIFILTITKLKNDSCTYYDNNSTIYCFDNINDLLNFYSFIKEKKINLIDPYVYQFSNKYYFFNNEKNINLENILLEFSSPINNYNLAQDIFKEYGNKKIGR